MTWRRPGSRDGQSLVEACIVIAVACLIFFGLVQVSHLHMVKTSLTYAASAGARARAVGFNDFMVWKVVRAAAIPSAGRMVTPDTARTGDASWGQMRPGAAWDRSMAARMPTHPQSVVEQSRIPLFLATDRWGETMAVLDYERWEDLQHWTDAGSEDFVQVGAQQDYPLNFPMARTFYADGYARLRSADFESGHSVIRENHGELYLEP